MILDQPLKELFSNKSGKDSNAKSLLKSISWRIVGTVDTIVISYFIMGHFMMGLSIPPKAYANDTEKEYA